MKLLRWLISPYKNWKIQKVYKIYLASEDRQRLALLKNTHRGERCFIIGNGPSLRTEDLEKLKHEFTFAANRIYEIFPRTTWRPTVYSVVDPDFLNAESENVLRVSCDILLLPFCFVHSGQQQLNVQMIRIWVGAKCFDVNYTAPWVDQSAYIPEDLSLGFSEGRTVTFIAIQMALYMGFNEIYLLGVDFNYSKVINKNGEIQTLEGVIDYFNQKTYDTTLQYFVPTKHAYEAAREYCDAHGIVIRNATRGGKLEAFKRVDLDEVLQSDSSGGKQRD